MKTAVITFIIIVSAGLIVFVRQDMGVHVVRALPFLGGYDPGLYDLAGIVMIGLVSWGIFRLRRRGSGDK